MIRLRRVRSKGREHTGVGYSGRNIKDTGEGKWIRLYPIKDTDVDSSICYSTHIQYTNNCCRGGMLLRTTSGGEKIRMHFYKEILYSPFYGVQHVVL